MKRTFSFGVQFCEFSHTHEPASFYRASQTLHCDRSEAKRFRLTLSRCSLCCRGLSGTKPAASPRLPAWTRGTSTPGAQKSPATPRAPRVPPGLAPPPPALVLDASDLVSIPAALPSPEGHGHRTLRQRPPTSETGLLRSGVPPRLAGAGRGGCSLAFITERRSIVWVCRFVHAIAPEAHCVGPGPGNYEGAATDMRI